MNGERDHLELQRMLAPALQPETYVYCCFTDFQLPAGMQPVCSFHEEEGLTAIVEKQQAERALAPYVFEARLITLTVHSPLKAVGFLATISKCLAQAKIPCNEVATFHHDHLFIPVDRAEEALALLQSLSAEASQGAVA